jgi:diguanylate cyclase (GGDEF)-like protein
MTEPVPDAELLAALAVLALAVLAAFRLGGRANRPRRRVLTLLRSLTSSQLLTQEPPKLGDRNTQAAVDRLWTIGRDLGTREAALAAQNTTWQRRYGQAAALIDLMAEFNQVMHLGAVLDRLSHGLSRFFAGDAVAIWIRAAEDSLELAAGVAASFPSRLRATDRWVAQLLAGDSAPLPPPWLEEAIPFLAAPLLDAQGHKIGIVTLISHRRSAYTTEDGAFLRTVIGHAAMAIQNATMYQFVDSLSRVDPLTGLLNRREFDRRLDQEMARSRGSGRPLSLVMIDADHFKKINDQLGHQEGDRVLQRLAQLILLVPRRAEDAAFRIGGEEFAVLMTDTEKLRAISAADSLRRLVERIKVFGERARPTVSLGVATWPEDGQTAAALVQAADRALYQAKAVGRNQVQAA